jgi:hypothetical protein
MRSLLAAGLLLLPVVAGADEIYLKSGGHLSGVVVEDHDGQLVVDVAPGRISVPRSHVDRVVTSASPLALFRDRAARLANGDARGWLDLALWAQERDLTTQARQAFEHVLAVDPDNAVAQRAMGHVLMGDRWVTPEESYRAQGYVFFEGAWVTLQERQALVAERAAQAEAVRARAESEARVREAEARARTAEAEAHRAEVAAAAEQAQATGGIPYGPYVGGYGYPGTGPVFTAVPGFTTLGVVPGFVSAPGIISPFPTAAVGAGFGRFGHRGGTRVVVNVNTPRCTNPVRVAPVLPVVTRAGVMARTPY